MPFRNLLQGTPGRSSDTAIRLSSAQAHSEGCQAELAAREERYRQAVARSAGDPDLATESAESKRAHESLEVQRRVVERAVDHVQAAAEIHRAAVQAELDAARDSTWQHIDELGAQRAALGRQFEDAAKSMAECQAKFRTTTAELYAAFPPEVRTGPSVTVIADWRSALRTELRRVGVIDDEHLSIAGPVLSLVERMVECRRMAQLMRDKVAA